MIYNLLLILHLLICSVLIIIVLLRFQIAFPLIAMGLGFADYTCATQDQLANTLDMYRGKVEGLDHHLHTIKDHLRIGFRLPDDA